VNVSVSNGAPSRVAATRLAAFALVAIAVVMLVSAASAAAQTFTVSSLLDSGVEGDGSLRGEVKAANKLEGPDTIVFAPGVTGTITFAGPGIVINGPLDIEGPGPGQLTIQQTAARRVFEIEPSGGEAVKIAGLHLDGGTAPNSGEHPGQGGDVFNAGAYLTLEDDLITGASAEEGGGVASTEGTTIRSTTISENFADEEAGVAIYTVGKPWAIIDSTITDNVSLLFAAGLLAEGPGLLEGTTIADNIAGTGGGGVEFGFAAEGTTITVRNSTIADNHAEAGAGILVFGFFDASTVAFEDTTIAGNVADLPGAGVAIEPGPSDVSLLDTIVAGNIGEGAPSDVGAEPGHVSAAFSLVGAPDGTQIAEAVPGSDLYGVDPKLAPLADNGGPTETMLPAAGSPVINKGGGPLSSDQRGDPRPVIYAGVPLSSAPGANGADIGAVELASPPASSPSPMPTAPPPPPTIQAAPRKLQVKLSCPKSAGPGGCFFALQVVSAKPRRVKAKAKGKGGHVKAIKPTPESAVATRKLGPGKSALLTFTPKPKFAAKLDAATKLLVRETETVRGKAKTSYRRLTVAPG
jgi:Right handed beta helix region